MICDQIILHRYLIRSIMWKHCYLYWWRMMLNNEHSNRIIFEMELLVHIHGHNSILFIRFSWLHPHEKWCKFQNIVFSEFSDWCVLHFKVMHWVRLSAFSLYRINFYWLISQSYSPYKLSSVRRIYKMFWCWSEQLISFFDKLIWHSLIDFLWKFSENSNTTQLCFFPL